MKIVLLLVSVDNEFQNSGCEEELKYKVYFTCYLFILLISFGCGSSAYLNTNRHKMSQAPKNIILSQVAGLGVTHLGALKFGLQSDQEIDFSESYSCSGVLWPQNFSTMRPKTFDAMNGQIFGSKSMDGSCQDFELIPFWDRYLTKDKQVIILEIGSDKSTSLEGKLSCEGKNILEKVTLLKMNSGKEGSGEYFDYKKRGAFKPGVFFDRNCALGNNKKCQSTAFENIRYVFENGFVKNKNVIFLIRDFNYQKLLKKRKFKAAFTYLQALFSALQVENFQGNIPRDLLTLVLGSSSSEIEFPKSATDWNSLIEGRSLSLFRYSGLQSLSLARGASAENFCGSFFDSEVVERIFFHAERKKSVTDFFQGIIEW